jgi:hypothetical protein
MLAVLGTIVFTASVLRFRRDLAPDAPRSHPGRPPQPVAEGAGDGGPA